MSGFGSAPVAGNDASVIGAQAQQLAQRLDPFAYLVNGLNGSQGNGIATVPLAGLGSEGGVDVGQLQRLVASGALPASVLSGQQGAPAGQQQSSAVDYAQPQSGSPAQGAPGGMGASPIGPGGLGATGTGLWGSGSGRNSQATGLGQSTAAGGYGAHPQTAAGFAANQMQPGADTGTLPGGSMNPANNAGYMSFSPLAKGALKVLGVTGPVGAATAGVLGSVPALNNVATTNFQLQAAGLQPLGQLQALGAVTGANDYASLKGLGDAMQQQGIPSSVTQFGNQAMQEQAALDKMAGNLNAARGGEGGGGGSGSGYSGYGGGGGQAGGTSDTDMSHAGFAAGGVIRTIHTDSFLKKLSGGSGLVRGVSPGRADAVHASVPKGGYVVPADVVSGLGQGNTMAGARHLTKMMPMPRPKGFSSGGRVETVPVRLSAGEYFVHPHHVSDIGDGDADRGSAALDALVHHVRAAVAHRSLTAPPPR